MVVERIVFTPVGKGLNIPDIKYNLPEPNKVLEAAYAARQKNYKDLSKLAGLTERQVERWFRQRQRAGR